MISTFVTITINQYYPPPKPKKRNAGALLEEKEIIGDCGADPLFSPSTTKPDAADIKPRSKPVNNGLEFTNNDKNSERRINRNDEVRKDALLLTKKKSKWVEVNQLYDYYSIFTENHSIIILTIRYLLL